MIDFEQVRPAPGLCEVCHDTGMVHLVYPAEADVPCSFCERGVELAKVGSA